MTSVKLEGGSATTHSEDNELQEIQYEILVEPNFSVQATPSASTSSSKSIINGVRRPRSHVYSVIDSSTDDGTGSTPSVATADFQADPQCSTIELSDPSMIGEDGNTEDYIIHHHHDVNTTPVAFQRPSDAGQGAMRGKANTRGRKRGRPRGRIFSAATIRVKKETDPDNPDTVPRKRFCSRWFNIPEIAPWLEESILPNHAYCKFCQKDLTAGKSELYKHMNSKRHRQRAEFFGLLVRQNGSSDLSASERSLQELRALSPPRRVPEGVVVPCSSPPPGARTLPPGISFPSRKFQVYLADDMHVPQSKEVMEAAEGLRRGRVRELESRAAQLLGKKAAFFCLTGTMANSLAVMAHCPQSGGVVIAGDRSHIYCNCQDALSRLNHVTVRVVRNESDGRVNLEEVRELLSVYTPTGPSGEDCIDLCQDRRPPPQYQLTRPTVLCLENTHTSSGGHVLPEYFMLAARKTCDELELQLHLDGARLLHAAYASDSSPAALAAHADTLTLCLNKGIDAPNGCVIAGPKDFIDRCRQLSSVFCVSSVRTEALAASCSKALSHYVQHVAKAHLYARNLFKGLSRMNNSAVTLSYGEGATNMILLECDGVRVTPQHLVDRLRQMPSSEIDVLKERTSIAARVWSRNTVRLVTHSGLTPEQVNAAIKKLRHVFNEYDNLLVLEYNVVDHE